jgi:hypothetical protein
LIINAEAYNTVAKTYTNKRPQKSFRQFNLCSYVFTYVRHTFTVKAEVDSSSIATLSNRVARFIFGTTYQNGKNIPKWP